MGNGSTRRPSRVPKDQVDKNWEKIFGPKKPGGKGG